MEEKYLCSHCGAELTQEEMTEFEGNIYCADCLNDLTTVCDCCGDRIRRDEAEGDSETTLCHHCYDYNYTTCEDCGVLIHNDDAYYDDDSDYPYCQSCYEKLQEDSIKSYNYKPEPIFYGSGVLFMGVELEIDNGGEDSDNANELLMLANRNSEHIYCKHDGSAVCVTGHTRHATHGDKKKNYNNHPFAGACKNLKFALSHNGVLINDADLKKQYHLPKTKIATDSYIAVQLLEKKKQLNVDSVKFMAENISGSFAFSILDSSDTLWLIRGDSPLSLVHLPKYRPYVYASTDEILYKSLVDTKLFNEIKTGSFEEITVRSGDILRILPNGKFLTDKFSYTDYSDFHWWDYSLKDDYIEELKSVAAYQGYSPEVVDTLLAEGFMPEEIEDYIYCME